VPRNLQCPVLKVFPSGIVSAVGVDMGVDMGIAMDNDGDIVVFIDEKGNITRDQP